MAIGPLTIPLPIKDHRQHRPSGGDTLTIRYDLRGDLADLVMPAPVDMPARRHGPWEETCFEFFLGVKGYQQYWEFNLSPAGDWNVYRFAGYRQGMAEETAFTSLPFTVRRRPESLRLALELEVGRIISADQPLSVGIAAVIKPRAMG